MLFGKNINRYYGRYALRLIIGIASLIWTDVFNTTIPSVYRLVVNGINDGSVLIDGVSVPFDMDFLLDRVCVPMFVIIVGMVIGRFTWRVCFIGMGISMETDLRSRMFAHCETLSAQYYQVNNTGELMSLFTNDLETVQDCFGSGLMVFLDAPLLGGIAFAKMVRMDPVLALLALIPMALLLAVSTIVGKVLAEKWRVRQEAAARLSDFTQEHFSGIAVVKAFVKETAELMAFRKINRENEDANVRHTRASTLLNILVSLFVESVICIILGYGGWLVWKHEFDAGKLVEFIGYFNLMVWPVMAISDLIGMRARGKASLARIDELLSTPADVTDRTDVKDCDVLKGNIELRSLTFRYPDGQNDVLRDVSFKISAGQSVGIIGKTGSGKSTLVDLLLRIYNVPDGTIFLDGRDINSIPIHTVRSHTAYVPQDGFLFSDTIAANIAFASDTDSQELVERAACLADVHDNIAGFSRGYRTMLGERGVTVSGGQKQRIAIARALMKNAAILILDDSVSAVDIGTEKKILENLCSVREGKTTILIAHRVSTVEHMDLLVFLDDGRVAAVGTHDELYAACPQYREMVDLQRANQAQEESHE